MRMVEEVMTRGVVTVPDRMPAVLARQIAADVGIRHLVVTRRSGLAGVLCVCDLRTIGAEDPVEACMANPVVTVAPGTTIEATAAIMRERLVGCLPVTAGNHVVGIVTRGDFSRLGFSDEQLGILRCASCGYGHNVIAPLGTPDVGFCLFCRERAAAPDDITDLGGGG